MTLIGATDRPVRERDDIPDAPTENVVYKDPHAIQEPASSAHPVANRVSGSPRFVFSPYKKIIDVNGLPPGRLVADPTYEQEQKKYFRVP